jgi:GNAT superfamily N-acetyltransferase
LQTKRAVAAPTRPSQPERKTPTPILQRQWGQVVQRAEEKDIPPPPEDSSDDDIPPPPPLRLRPSKHQKGHVTVTESNETWTFMTWAETNSLEIGRVVYELDKNTLLIGWVEVYPKFVGKGLSYVLINYAAKQAVKKKKKYIEADLDVARSGNTRVEIYATAGMTEEREPREALVVNPLLAEVKGAKDVVANIKNRRGLAANVVRITGTLLRGWTVDS